MIFDPEHTVAEQNQEEDIFSMHCPMAKVPVFINVQPNIFVTRKWCNVTFCKEREGSSWLCTHSIHTLLTVLPEKKSSYFLAIKTNIPVTLGALNCSKSPRRSGKILIYRYQVLSLPATPKSLTWHAQQGERCKQFPELLDFQMRAGETGSLLPRQFVRKPPICDLSK